MAISSDVRDQLALRFEVLLPHLNERQRRLLLAAEARLLGHGGVRAVAQVAGVSESTVREGVFELEEGQDPFPDGRARREGGGPQERGGAGCQGSSRRCSRWLIRMSGVTRSRRCGGRPSRCGTWPGS